MRLPATWAICALLSAPLAAPATSAAPIHVATAQNAILCLGPADLEQAHRPAIAKSQVRLRSLRCMRTEPGIPITVLDGPRIGGPWRVRVFPQGISGGVTMWGYPSAFVAPDGSQLIRSVQADR
jgi:hypothetical protein